jgi:pyruvate formate-lyase/glycerol dehydratase family glycyl radical enzyme
MVNVKTKENRISRLRENMLHIPDICIQRAYWWTKSYMETEGEPEVIRRAKALAKILENLPIYIDDDELIVGRSTSKERGGMLFPEIQWEYILKEIELFSSRDWDRCGSISDEEKKMVEDTLPYWKGKCTWDRFNASMPPEIRRIHGGVFFLGTSSMSGVHYGHETIDYSRLLKKGLSGIKKEAQEKLESLDLTKPEDFKKYQFLQAVIITLDAAAAFAKRYADLASHLAAQAINMHRKKELDAIASICRRVPLNPAGSFHEALQSIWFTHIVIRNEGWGPGLGFGRLDQYLYPFYQKDLSDGIITRDTARELASLFLIKVNDLAFISSTVNIETLAGFPTMVSITLGGVTPGGKDAVNELSYLLLEADEQVALNVEEITIRVNSSNSDAFLMKALEVSKKLRGKFKFVSDNTIISLLLNEGRPIEHARDYVLVGCFTPAVPSYSLDVTGGMVNAPMILELALNNGVSRITGEQVGPATGDPRKFKSYDDVWDAFKRQVEFFVPKMVTARNIDTQLYAEFALCPFMSAFFKPCISNGKDLIAGGTAPNIRECFGFSGVPNIGDSLAAVKKVVFDDKLIDIAGLVKALDDNFKEKDRLLQALSKAPKFGNDIDYVDTIINDVISLLELELGKYKGLFGSKPAVAISTGTGHLLMGTQVGATPEGRKAGEPFAEGGISPHQGRNTSGPTATLRSVSKLDHLKIRGGSVLNMKFNPDVFADEKKKVKFLSMLRTYCESGGYHVQFNIISGETLRDAQKHPENYKDLLVRVATYSAYFVELSPRMQEDIIARTEFEEV